jgi:alpha,alpha-trehalose-phosphate synthase [UDP-forming]/trehalose-phosphatase
VDTRIDFESKSWLELVRHQPLGILTDLDGTLLPFASTPEEASPSAEIQRLVADLSSLPGVTLAIVSGRPKEWLDRFFPAPRTALLVAEHGAWRGGPAGWESMLSVDNKAVDSLAEELRDLTGRFAGALIERKTWSIALHYRRVAPHDKMGLLVQATAVIDPWLARHSDFEELSGVEVIEIRPRSARKGNAVAWVRGLLGPKARLIVVGDDVTDEDMFSATSDDDAPVLVGDAPGRLTAARWRLESSDEVLSFYRWIVASRREAREPVEPPRRPSRVETLPEITSKAFFDLLVLSNRLPELRSTGSPHARKRNVGGLVSALGPALMARRGIWLGWSGRTRAEATATEIGFDKVGELSLAWVDFPEDWHRHYYNGFSNSALWPLLHSFPGRLKISHHDWHCYERANEAFASAATKLVGPEGTIWVHDYHLLLLGKYLRARGHRGPIGLFQHIPFPGPDIFFLLPWAHEILSAMLSFDLVGFHTPSYVANFLSCMAYVPGARIEGQSVVFGDHVTRVGAFPLGIIPSEFQNGDHPSANDEIAAMMRILGPIRLVLGVDRLDYTKGIPERIAAFGSMLEQFPAWRRKTCMVQVSVPSRADIPDYADQRSRVENIVGRINGEYGEADWVPIRYLYRSYGRKQLSELYRAADVGYVTPLRDGMNLVAKEYVAAQDPEKPGVLLLSRFAGAAEELHDALLTNPWDPEGAARDLVRALEMPLAERKERHDKLNAIISKTTALTWAEDFLSALGEAGKGS